MFKKNQLALVLLTLVMMLTVYFIKAEYFNSINVYNCYLVTIYYSESLVTLPAPTVRPPSRIENLVPCSTAIG